MNPRVLRVPVTPQLFVSPTAYAPLTRFRTTHLFLSLLFWLFCKVRHQCRNCSLISHIDLHSGEYREVLLPRKALFPEVGKGVERGLVLGVMSVHLVVAAREAADGQVLALALALRDEL